MSSLFKQIASLITVAELQEPLGKPLYSDDSLPFFPDDCGIYLVKDRGTGSIVGWIDAENNYGEEDAGDVCEQIGPGARLTGDVTALKAVDLFSTTGTPVFLVVQQNQITGTLRYEDLFKPVFALCLLALTLELEQEALKVLSVRPDRSWEALGKMRRNTLLNTYRDRGGSDKDTSSTKLSKCTMFCDKSKMLTKRGLPPGISKKKLESTFSRAQDVRNDYAHPREAPEVMDRQKLVALVQDVEQVLQALRECLPAEQEARWREFPDIGRLEFPEPT